MAQMKQVILLTTEEISNDTLRRLFNLVAREHSRVNWAGTAFKLAASVDLPVNPDTGLPNLGPQDIVPIYGELAS